MATVLFRVEKNGELTKEHGTKFRPIKISKDLQHKLSEQLELRKSNSVRVITSVLRSFTPDEMANEVYKTLVNSNSIDN